MTSLQNERDHREPQKASRVDREDKRDARAFRSAREQPKTPTTMKHLLTAIACFFALSMSAQAPNPDWNPDFNADEIIGATDLLGLLSAFGNEFFASDNPVVVTLAPEMVILSNIGGHYQITNEDILIVRWENFAETNISNLSIELPQAVAGEGLPNRTIQVCSRRHYWNEPANPLSMDVWTANWYYDEELGDNQLEMDVFHSFYMGQNSCKKFTRIDEGWFPID